MSGKGRWFGAILGGLLVLLAGMSGLAYSGATPEPERDASDIVKKASPAVVRVEVRDGLRRVATGVVIDKEGYIATTALISPGMKSWR